MNFESNNLSDEELSGDSDDSIWLLMTNQVIQKSLLNVPKGLFQLLEWGILSLGEKRGYLVQLQGEGMPTNYINLMLDEILWENICLHTNENATNEFFKPTLTPKSRTYSWKELNITELKILLGLLFYIGTVRMNKIHEMGSMILFSI